jgi:uncharacterized protein YhbP (UPF0306 family)
MEWSTPIVYLYEYREVKTIIAILEDTDPARVMMDIANIAQVQTNSSPTVRLRRV